MLKTEKLNGSELVKRLNLQESTVRRTFCMLRPCKRKYKKSYSIKKKKNSPKHSTVLVFAPKHPTENHLIKKKKKKPAVDQMDIPVLICDRVEDSKE